MAIVAGATIVAPLSAQADRVNPELPFTQGDATHIAPPYEPAMPPDSVSMPPAERGRYTLNSYADCLVRSNRKSVVSVLQMAVGTRASEAAMAKISVDECLGNGELKMDSSLLRGALYRALYRTDFFRAVTTLAPQPIDYAADMESGVDSAQYVALHNYADCVVRSDPEDARTILLSATASGKERDAVSRLAPHLSACLSKGTQIHFSRSVLLGLIAEVLFRLSQPVVPKPAPVLDQFVPSDPYIKNTPEQRERAYSICMSKVRLLDQVKDYGTAIELIKLCHRERNGENLTPILSLGRTPPPPR